MEVGIDDVITTRYFGGYESMKIVQVHADYFVVSRFSGQATDILPKDRIEKVTRRANGQ